MNSSGSIFDYAGDQNKKKKKKTTQHNPEPKSVISDAEINKSFTVIYGYIDKVTTKLEEAYKMQGLSPKEADFFLNTPGNFSKDAWDRIQRSRSMWEEKVGSKAETPDLSHKKKKKKKKKSGQGKTLGARKRWLSM
ncbi:hypothetical protein N9Y92_02880 [Chlamydiales bacterium]|nr:hypothetical protein [Chlamydiales bacterium]